jgi:hypothetical protein
VIRVHVSCATVPLHEEKDKTCARTVSMKHARVNLDNLGACSRRGALGGERCTADAFQIIAKQGALLAGCFRW